MAHLVGTHAVLSCSANCKLRGGKQQLMSLLRQTPGGKIEEKVAAIDWDCVFGRIFKKTATYPGLVGQSLSSADG